MWLFKKKSAKDYIEQIIRVARAVKDDFPTVYETGKIRNIRRLLLIIERFNVKQFKAIKEETGSTNLMKAAEGIALAANQALKDIDDQYNFTKAEMLVQKIIELEAYVANNFEAELRFAPSKELGKILRYSPQDALAKGYLFRGLSDSDYQRVLHGTGITARKPNGTISVANHILDPTNNPDTQYISLTADVDVARHFGRPIAVTVAKLRGNLMSPDQIRRATAHDTRVERLRRKNTEFLLAPTRTTVAQIPANAVVR